VSVVEHPQSPWYEWAENDFALHQKTGLHRENVDWLYERSEKELLQLRLLMRHRNENSPSMLTTQHARHHAALAATVSILP
jgi:hypothetical protein